MATRLSRGQRRQQGRAHRALTVEGPATDFCQVVAQTRGIADVSLSITGKAATAWMSQAQCFAGPPNDPPAPGSRYIQTA